MTQFYISQMQLHSGETSSKVVAISGECIYVNPETYQHVPNTQTHFPQSFIIPASL